MHSKIKRILSCVLVAVIVFSSLIVSGNLVFADSNDRIATYIKLAKDGTITDGTTDGMTEDQLRFLGVYLSNFYIPFGTEIGTAADSDMEKTTKTDMADTLKQKFAFSDELANSIVDTVYGYTRSSLKDLKYYIKYGDKIYDLPFTSCTYYTYFAIMCGRVEYFLDGYVPDQSNINSKGCPSTPTIYPDDKLEKGSDIFGSNSPFKDEKYPRAKLNALCRKIFSDNVTDQRSKFDAKIVTSQDFTKLSKDAKKQVTLFYKLCCGSFDKIYLGYTNKEGKIVFVSDAYTKQKYDDEGNEFPLLNKNIVGSANYSPSQIAFFKALESTNQLTKGYGTACFDFTTQDTDFNTLNSKAKDGTITKEEAVAMTMFSTPMKVDCFGDIVRFGANHKVIVIPGCMNPYMWQPVDSDGNDEGDAGSLFNIANAVCMAQAAITDGVSNGKSVLVKSVNKGKYLFNFESLNKAIVAMKRSEFFGDRTLISMRIISGSAETDIEKHVDDFWKLFFENIGKGDESFIIGYAQNWFQWGSSVNNVVVPVPRSNSADPTNKYAGVEQTHTVTPLKKVVFIDNLGAYVNSDGSLKKYDAFNVADFLNENGLITDKCNSVSFGKNDFDSLYANIEAGKMDVPSGASEQALCTLYVTYCWASLYDESNKKDTIGKLGYRMNSEDFPDMSNSPISFGSLLSGSEDAQLMDIKNWVYYILHPTEGFDYFRILITNKVNHLLLGWHNDMTGTNGVGITTGTTKYRSAMGYVTMPDLSEIQWTNSLINFYNNCIPFLIVILIILMVFAFITGILDIQHAIVGVLIFAVFTLMPVNLINGVVGQSNRISQNIYGDKFTYWALVQQESYATVIDEAANATGSSGESTYENYLRTLYSANESVYNNQGNESILLKWQAPKKMASLVLTEDDANSLSGLNETGHKMLSGMLNKTYSGESYIDDEESVYMYRSYLDITNFSRYIYNGIDKKHVKSRSSLSSINTKNWHAFQNTNGNMVKSKSDLQSDYKKYITDGYDNGTNFGSDTELDKTYYLTVPLSSNIINDALSEYGKLANYKDTSDLIPINSDVFNFGVPMFTKNKKDFSYENLASTGMITEAERKDDLKNFMAKYTSEEDYVGLAAYGLYSENPYYYFSWKLYEDGLDSDSSLSGSTGFKNLLLGKEEGGYFYNTKGNGGLKDFMNMRGLFTYIIPYMKQCNDIVREWDNIYGIFVYDGVPTEEGHWSEVENDPELKQKYWHNLNVSRLYNLYCPWVDVMYDCSYSEAENITVMGKRVTIEDPLNPNSYPADRPMIFSESEMSDYGLSEADLTKAEKLILRCNEQFQERLYELLNYYNFSDVTLDSAAAMNCAFVFNNTFSENGLFTENHNIYPQSFDLANFSYDAFLRFILSNATGESMLESTAGGDGTSTGTTSGDFYERLVNRSSIVTILIMLVLDVVSIYVIPAFRIFFLVALFLLSIMLVLVSAFRIEDSMKFIRKILMQFLLPLGVFFGATIAFSWVVSLFMGVGSDSVTQSNKLQISMGDPVVTMLCMLALNILLLIVYWKVLKQALKDIAHHAKLLKGFGAAVVGAGVGFVAGAVASGVNGAQDVGSRAINGYRRHKYNKRADKDSESLERIANNSEAAQQGTGVENSRANTRGASDASANSEEIPNVRDASRDRRDSNVSSEDKQSNFKDKKDSIDSKAENGADINKSDKSKPEKNVAQKDSKPEKVDTRDSKESSSSEERIRNRQRVRRESNKQTSVRAEKNPNKESKSSKDIDKKTEK